MQLNEIIVDNNLRELTPRGTPLFPIEMYCNDISKFSTQYVPWHWHDECELVYVQEGLVVIESDGRKTEIPCGCGAFINSNRLHSMRSVNNKSCKMINIVFNHELIAGAPHSVFENKYVLPLITNSEVTVVVFNQNVFWQKLILDKIKNAFENYMKSAFGYELFIREQLSQIWLAVVENMGQEKVISPIQKSYTIKKLLAYIHENYMYGISLNDIAQCASIGSRTCNRYFKQQLGMTPFEYLMEYRVKIAAEKLISTSDFITDICYNTGFNDTSYFTKVFHKITGYTPGDFRKLKQKQAVSIQAKNFNYNNIF